MKLLFCSRTTGEFRLVDTHQQRLNHMRARLLQWASTVNNIDDNQKKAVRYVGITLTYRRVEDWNAGDIRDCLDIVRHSLGDNLIAYAWVAELQKRGAVHYHLALVVKRHSNIPRFDRAGWWPHGMTKIQSLKHVSGSYLIKYLQKGSDENGNKFPKGLRMFAVVVRKSALVTSYDRLTFRLSGAVGRVRRFVMEHLELSTYDADWSWKAHVNGQWWVWCKMQLTVLTSEWYRMDWPKNIPMWFDTGTPRRNWIFGRKPKYYAGLYRTIQLVMSAARAEIFKNFYGITFAKI